MIWRQTLILSNILIAIMVNQQVHGSGVFELRLKSFANEDGRDMAGQCCEGEERGARCGGACRPRFRICLSHYQAQIDALSSCTFGDVTTAILGDNGLSPIRFPFDFSWPGTFSLIVEAWHVSTSSNASADDAGVATNSSDVSVQSQPKWSSGSSSGLIDRARMQRWMDTSANWTEEVHQSAHTRMQYEVRVMCEEHYYGAGCGNMCRPRDDNFGHYTCSSTGKRLCDEGWTGDYCSKPECSPGCNDQHGFCKKPGECLCHVGWKGRLCDQCERYPACFHGSCQKPWECLCDDGWGGLLCNQDLNYCTNHKPCRNGGTCFNTGEGSYTCSCQPGYAGQNCEKKLSDCQHMPCLNGATCLTNGSSYQCECSKGWYGSHCEKAVQTCESRPCQHGGSCMDTIHGYKCSCALGYSGSQCQNYNNACSFNPCHNGSCSLLPNNSGYKCTCQSGFTGANCQLNIDDCPGKVCENGGTCIDLVKNYRCQCVPGFTGHHCQEKVNSCLIKPCANGGTCENIINDYKCKCRSGFMGKTCEMEVDECKMHKCKNGGTCYSGENGYQCECVNGFSGQYCEEESASNAVSTAMVGDLSRQVSINGEAERRVTGLTRGHWYVIAVLSIAVPLVVLIAALLVNRMKQRRKREQRKADEEARMQNERNSVHSGGYDKRANAHMIKNTWGQCVKNVDAMDSVDGCEYPKPIYAAVPADPSITPVYNLHRSRSQKQLNVDPPILRQSVYNRVSSKDLDAIVRTTTPVSLDNRLSVMSINTSHSNLSESSLPKEKFKSVQQPNPVAVNLLNTSSVAGCNNSSTNNVYVIEENFPHTLFATEV